MKPVFFQAFLVRAFKETQKAVHETRDPGLAPGAIHGAYSRGSNDVPATYQLGGLEQVAICAFFHHLHPHLIKL